MVGVVLSYAAAWAAAPGVAADVAQEYICALGDACGPAVIADDSGTYATPAEVDCRAISGDAERGAMLGPSDLPFFSDCAPVAADLRYRVSRFADSERPTGALGPQRSRRVTQPAPRCTGLPPDHGTLVIASVPPIAMYASALVPRPPHGPGLIGFARYCRAPARIIDPPERPPRG